MGDIATAAGVSRQTLYKEFGSREEFAQAFVMREVNRFLAAVEVAVREHLDDPATALSAAFDVFLTAAAEDPLVRTLLRGEASHSLLPLLTTQGEPVVAGATERLSAIILSGWPGGGPGRRAAAGRVPRAPGDQLRGAPRRADRDDRRLGHDAARPLHRARAALATG